MKKLLCMSVAFLLLMVVSCNKNSSVAESDQADTSAVVNETLETAEVDAMASIINEVSASLDSIEKQENMIYKAAEGETNKERILKQLSSFKQLLAEKQSRINDLSKKNAVLSESSKKTIQNLQKMVDFLEKQLEAKTQQIAKMEELLNAKDAKISEFRYNINELSKESDYLKDQNYEQDKKLNTIYYVVATKSELKNSGLLKGGFLSKKKVDNDQIDNSKFKKADKRYLTKIEIPSVAVKILSNNPTSSYILKKNEDKTATLEITDAEKFWSVSPYLIIQY